MSSGMVTFNDTRFFSRRNLYYCIRLIPRVRLHHKLILMARQDGLIWS